MKKNNQKIKSGPSWIGSSTQKYYNQTNPSSPAKINAKFDFSWVSAFSLGITVFAAVLFGAGKAYRQAYIGVFGFDDSILPWPFQDLVYLGITKQLPILLAAPAFAIGIVLLITLSLGLTLWIGNTLIARRQNKNKENANKKDTKTTSSNDAILDLMQFLINCCGAILITSLLSLFFVARAETLGKTDAISHLKSASMENGPSQEAPKLSYVVIKREVEKQQISEEGYLVTCSDKACGIYVPDQAMEASHIIPLDHVVSFKRLR